MELSLAGKNSYVEIPYDSLLNPSETFTYELWARADRYDKEFRTPFSMRDMFVGVVLYASDHNFWEGWIGTGTNWSATKGPKVRLGEWTHLAMVFDRHVLKWYVNGILYRETHKAYQPNRKRPLRLGFSSDGFDLNYPGAVDEVKVWSIARSHDEIIRSMTGSGAEKDVGLVGYWSFNEKRKEVTNTAAPGQRTGMLMGSAALVPSTRPLQFPLLLTDKNIVEFPETNVGVRRFDTLLIMNKGTERLTGRISYEGRKDIVVDPADISLAPNEQFKLPVRFFPIVDGRKTGTITIRHNGPGALHEVIVAGNCRMPVIDSVSFDQESSKGVIHGDNFTTLMTPQVFFGNLRAPIRDQSNRSLTITVPPGTPFAPINITTFMMTVSTPSPVAVSSAVKGMITPESFIHTYSLPMNDGAKKILLIDLDGNGKSDLVVPESESLSVSIYPDIELPPDPSSAKKWVSIPMTVVPSLILDEDIDNDGKTDLVVISAKSKEMSIYRNISSVGRLLFRHDQTIPIETDPIAVAAGDVNGDLKKDLVMICGVSRMMYLFRNVSGFERCSVQFEWKDNVQKNPSDIVITDLDGDGRADLAFSGDHEAALHIFQNFTRHGQFVFEFAQMIIGGGRVSSLKALDVDGDGKQDLITLNQDANTFSVYRNISQRYAQMGERRDYSTGNSPAAMTLGDLTGDGKPEIVIANEIGRSVSVFTHNGTSGAITASTFGERRDFPVNGSPVAIRLHDADFDGRPDLFVTDAKSRSMLIIRNDVVPDSPWFWFWVGAGAFGALGFLVLGIRYTELKKIRKQITALEEQRRLQDEFSKKMIESQENERTRIAQELHDGLGQELLLIKNSALLSLIQKEGEEKMKEQLEHISNATSKVIKIARDISYNLRPAELDRLGLSETLRSIVVELRKSTAVKVSGEVDMIDGLVPKEMEINIVRIIQESTANALKHSRATELRIAVNHLDLVIVISVEDNGVGMPPAGSLNNGNKKGLGLAGIDERVRIMKGTLAIHSEPEKGTTVKATIPVHGTPGNAH